MAEGRVTRVSAPGESSSIKWYGSLQEASTGSPATSPVSSPSSSAAVSWLRLLVLISIGAVAVKRAGHFLAHR